MAVMERGRPFEFGWQTIIIVAFLYIFRREISQKIGFDSNKIEKFAASRKWKRVKALIGFCLAIWIVVDIIWLFVVDIAQVADSWPSSSY